jgi:hypothetical protein
MLSTKIYDRGTFPNTEVPLTHLLENSETMTLCGWVFADAVTRGTPYGRNTPDVRLPDVPASCFRCWYRYASRYASRSA